MSDFTLPPAVENKHKAVLGMNGSAKTSVVKAISIEPALAAGARVCIVDPTGVAWGLRLKASGKTASGLPIYIVGGEHADFPLEPRSGALWAEIVGTSGDSFIFDLKRVTVGARTAWFTDFAEAIMIKNKGALRLVLDEVHLFAPQAGAQGGGQTPAMLHATNNLLALGRSIGLRVTMISQRPAKVHKDALTQAHSIIAMKLIAPQDKKAVREWIEDQTDAGGLKEIMASLATLKPGEGWVYAPADGILERVKFPWPKTFDSSKAPEDGDDDAPDLPKIDAGAIKGRLAEIAEEAKANSVPALKARIVELERAGAEAVKAAGANALDATAAAQREQGAYEAGHGVGFAKATEQARNVVSARMAGVFSEMRDEFGKMLTAAGEALKAALPNIAPQHGTLKPKTPPEGRTAPKPPSERQSTVPSRETSVRAAGAAERGNFSLSPGERGILRAAAGNGAAGITRPALTAIVGLKRSTRDLYLRKLLARYLIELAGDRVSCTAAGLGALGDGFEPLPRGRALQEHWLSPGLLSPGEANILLAAIKAAPNSVDRESLTEAIGLKRSTRDLYIRKLAARELITATREGVALSEHMQ